ncbi:MAG: DpnI domain-containing protein [Terracidiphilus sp.]
MGTHGPKHSSRRVEKAYPEGFQMLLHCDLSAATGYTSKLQIARILSEKWFLENAYCLGCESDRLFQTPANTRASDFTCRACGESYELKASLAKPKGRVVDGAYSALISRIASGCVPNLMLLERSESWQIRGLIAIHHLFLTPEIIEQRKPLSATARRAGWIGCVIRVDMVAEDAQIAVIRDGAPAVPEKAREAFQRFRSLAKISPDRRGWATLTLAAIRKLSRPEFTLGDLYSMERSFAEVFPNNRNIRPKIRQQLQVLRDLGYLDFLGAGHYRLSI